MSRCGPAGERLLEAVDQQEPVRQAGERVVERLVDRVLDRPRIGEREARVLGEGDQHLALGLRVGAPGPVGGDDEAADDLAVLAHRRGERGADAVGGERGEAVGVGGVVLDHDQPALGGRPAAGARAERAAADLARASSGLTPAEATMISCSGSSGSISRRPTVSSPSSSCGAGDDRVEDLVQVAPADDRALDLRKPLEQPLALRAASRRRLRVLRRSGGSLSSRSARSASTTRSSRTVSASIRAIPRARLRSSDEKTSRRGGRGRARRGARRRSASRGPGSRRSRVPRAGRSRRGARDRSPPAGSSLIPNPVTRRSTRRCRRSPPTSASKASVARSIGVPNGAVARRRRRRPRRGTRSAAGPPSSSARPAYQAPRASAGSADRERDEGLAVERVDALDPRDLAVGVEARERRLAGAASGSARPPRRSARRRARRGARCSRRRSSPAAARPRGRRSPARRRTRSSAGPSRRRRA